LYIKLSLTINFRALIAHSEY